MGLIITLGKQKPYCVETEVVRSEIDCGEVKRGKMKLGIEESYVSATL